MFGLPTEDDGNRTDALLGQNIISSTRYQPDFDALRGGLDPDRPRRRHGVQGPARQPRRDAVAERLGTEPVIFPSDHGGFLGGEYGQKGDPDGFAAKLREVLAEG